MTYLYIEKIRRKIFFALICSVLLTGCATPRMAITSGTRQIQLKLPTVDIDRYEAVIYPAGSIQH